MKFPESLLGSRLDALEHGSVLRFHFGRAGKMKFGVLLNANWPDRVLLAISTSQLEFYDRVNVEADIIRIAAGTYRFFPKDTVINLREIVELPRTEIIESFTCEGRLDEADMSKIDSKIAASRLLSRSMKRRVLGLL